MFRTALLNRNSLDLAAIVNRIVPMDSDRRGSLIYRMTSAKGEEEITEAQQDADLWLRANPGDTDVAAAKQTLDERSEKLDDPERSANKATWIALGVAIPLAIAVSLMFSASWGIAVAGGVYVGAEIASFVWGVVREGGEESRSKRNKNIQNR